MKKNIIGIKKMVTISTHSNIVVITAPHALCPSISFDNHPCDTLAADAAQCLYKAVDENEKEHFVAEVFLPTKIIRDECDLNREDCRVGTDYRQNLTQYLQDKQQDIFFLLDVHSFPHKPFDWLQSREVYLIDDSKNLEAYTLSLLNYLKSNKVSSDVVHGKNNDIQDEARNVFDIKSILIEFNESLDEKRLLYITQQIVMWLVTLKITTA